MGSNSKEALKAADMDKILSLGQEFTIEQVMVKKIVCVNPSNSIKEVAEILSKSEFHALPVVDNNNLIGIVTTTDLIKYLLKQF